MADRIQLRRDTAANWTAYNPILLEGEPGIEIDTDQWKLGDGIHNWNALPYRGGECVQQRGQSTTVAMSQKAVTDELNEIYIKNTVEFSTTYQYKALNVSLKAGSIVTVLPNGNSSNYYFFYGADNTNNYITLTPGKTVILDHEIIAIKSSNSTTAITYVNTIFLTQDSVNDKLSLTSVFPVQNKVVKAAIDGINTEIGGINTEIGGINTKIAEIDGINEEFTIGTINTNIYAFNKILDINIKTGDTFKFRITGQGDIARFMLLCNGSYTTPSNLIKDYCQFDTWYEFTAIKDITSLGYQTGDNPNATDVVLELLLTGLKDSVEKNAQDIEKNAQDIEKNLDGIFVKSCSFDCHGFVKNCYVDASKINPLTTYAITNICKNHSEYGTRIYINGTIQNTKISNLNDIVKVGDFYLIVDWSVIPDGYNYNIGTGIVLNNDTIISKVLNEEILLKYEFDDLKSNIFTEPSQTTIGTINTNIGSFTKITDVDIKEGETFKFRITGDGDIARFLLTCNNGTSMDKRLQDHCQFDTWYEITAPFDLTSLGYQTGDNPNATNVVFELLYDDGSSLESKVNKNTNTLEHDVLGETTTKIGTINTNIYAFNKILDINIKTGDTFKFRITGQGDIARFMLLCNGSYTTPSNLIKDYCQFDTWYEFTAIKDITSLGYQTGDNPNATDVVLELLLGTSLQGRISKLEEEQPEDNANCAMMTSKLYLTDKRTDLFFSPLFANWQFLNNRLCRVSAEGASIYRHFRNFVTIDATQNGTLYFRTYNEKYDIIDSKAVNTIVTPQSKSGSIRCLFIGSSITGHGIYQNRLKTMCGEGFESIGTRHAGQDDDCYFEAVGGWGFAAFASYKTVKTNATSPFWHPANGRYWGVVGFWKDVMTYNEFDSSNPNSYVMNGRKTTATAAGFGQDGYISGSRLQVGDIMYDDANSHFVQWNGSSWVQIDTPTNWGFDFVKYGNMWNITAPDLFVMAELSTNDFRGASSTPNFTTWNNNAEAMFTALKAWKNDIKIAMLIPISTFGLTCVQGSEFFERSNYRMYQSRLNQIEHFDNREDEGIYLIDDAIFFDEEYGYGISTNADMTKPNQEYAGNEKLRVQTSSPHPNAQGEYLLADGMYGIIQYVRKTN